MCCNHVVCLCMCVPWDACNCVCACLSVGLSSCVCVFVSFCLFFSVCPSGCVSVCLRLSSYLCVSVTCFCCFGLGSSWAQWCLFFLVLGRVPLKVNQKRTMGVRCFVLLGGFSPSCFCRGGSLGINYPCSSCPMATVTWQQS